MAFKILTGISPLNTPYSLNYATSLAVDLRGSSQTPGITKGNLVVPYKISKFYAPTDSEHKFHKAVIEN